MALRFIFWSLLALVLGGLCVAQDVEAGFTLAALNSSTQNSNSTGAPLVIGTDGSTAGAGSYLTFTYASYPYDDYPSLHLVNGHLRASNEDGVSVMNATTVQSNEALGWLASSIYGNESATVYSLLNVNETDSTTNLTVVKQHSFLAADGVHDQWSLCPTKENKTAVFFNITPESRNSSGQCYTVLLSVILISNDSEVSVQS